MVLRIKNFTILGFHWKIRPLAGGGECSGNIEGRGLPKRGAWTVCQFRGGAWQEKGGGAFEKGGWYPNAHYDIIGINLSPVNNIQCNQ